MLLAVEGGGFFSSSASGYSKGLTLLFLGQKQHEDNKPMRVSPWNQYQLVDQEPDQLAPRKDRLSCGCASFGCFGCASTGIDSQSHLKVGPTRQQDTDSGGDDKACDPTLRAEHASNGKKVTLKSSLKKPSDRLPAPIPAEDSNLSSDDSHGSSCDIAAHDDHRRVQWTDVCGQELVHIREFEPRQLANFFYTHRLVGGVHIKDRDQPSPGFTWNAPIHEFYIDPSIHLGPDDFVHMISLRF